MTGVLQKLPVTLDLFKFSDSYGYLSFLWPWKANALPYKEILTNVKVWKYRYRFGSNWGSFARACIRSAEFHSSIARIWYVSYKNKQISWTMKQDDFKCQLRLATCGVCPLLESHLYRLGYLNLIQLCCSLNQANY